jgi:hypothetical protein
MKVHLGFRKITILADPKIGGLHVLRLGKKIKTQT